MSGPGINIVLIYFPGSLPYYPHTPAKIANVNATSSNVSPPLRRGVEGVIYSKPMHTANETLDETDIGGIASADLGMVTSALLHTMGDIFLS